MIRMDMSELVTAQSLSRIVGEHGKPDNHSALVNLVRSQPFSVVLLDEFERAAPEIWDLFLQVFDDGRLTDWTGETVDFRHCIIILTSNLGSRGGFEASVGFDRTGADFSETEVRKAIATTFRPEFINRLDRIVVFRPLGRSTMRQILHKELDEALLRRGLRRRGWAVDFEESAIEFLLEKGFAPDLGARPLKRAIERYLLSPVARTIVARTCPEGGQFLVVSGVRGKIDVLPVEAQTPKGAAH
jgi:ATP-dependent Clp protease ATP-binding subunit ClpC